MSMSDKPNEATAVEESEADTCVVCFKDVDIYSIGECDHPVCYECSTRMRVLCKQNECPICRNLLHKVIFTYNKRPYRELEAKNRLGYYSQKYKIGFYDAKIQRAFFDLLDHPCPKCNVLPFRDFEDLKHHVRREHNLQFCDLCTEHLKIFTFERRCYTQAELGLHRVKGDADNRSHRGHPLCEHCNKRYLDRDELFRHLRRDHYFCHFCDADGLNQFYKDYAALADHFEKDHYLCKEGSCAKEKFVGAFRTEIDYKAHIASVHGKTMNKQQAKQTRTLQLEITLGRAQGRSGQAEQGVSPYRSRGTEEDDDELDISVAGGGQHNRRQINIDRCNEDDFPSLAGSASGPSVSLACPPPPQFMRIRSGTSGLARTKENFPALGAGGGSIESGQRQSAQPISVMLRNPPAASTGAISRIPTTPVNGNVPGMVIHVSNRPATNNSNGGSATGKKTSPHDFPALPASGKSKKNTRPLDEDLLPSPSYVPMGTVPAKHRQLVDNYVSVANPNNFQKIQMVQKAEQEAKARKVAELSNAPKLTSQDFPSLGGGSNTKLAATATPTGSNWVKAQSDKKQRELENRKSKVAPAPLLPKDSRPTIAATSKKQPTNNKPSPATEQTTQSNSKKDKKGKEKKPTAEQSIQSNKSNGKAKEKSNNNHNNNNNNNEKSKAISGILADTATAVTPIVNGNDSSLAASASPSFRPPPGFGSQSDLMSPPPGFHSNVTVSSVAKSPNSLTFTNSLGENYSIVPVHTYVPPSNALQRNQNLVDCFKAALKTPEALEEFRHISQKFREGVYKTQPYYEHCQAALKDNFDSIFPELLALLPDIGKQQALYLVHTQLLNKLPASKRKPMPKIEVCATCKQVLFHDDLDSHRKVHELKENFPALGSSGGASSKNAGSSRK